MEKYIPCGLDNPQYGVARWHTVHSVLQGESTGSYTTSFLTSAAGGVFRCAAQLGGMESRVVPQCTSTGARGSAQVHFC
jgi:hypothetical protein